MNRYALPLIALCCFLGSTSLHAIEGSFSAKTGAVDYRAVRFAPTGMCEGTDKTYGAAKSIPAAGKVPAHCRIEGFLPTNIGFQINLPAKWNGRLYMFGNGGYAGEPHEGPGQQRMRDEALANGFATVRTDTGHLASDKPEGTFAEDPVALTNHAYGAVHATI